jgi:hypothetical protein
MASMAMYPALAIGWSTVAREGYRHEASGKVVEADYNERKNPGF